MKQLCSTILALLMSFNLCAAKWSVDMRLDSASILIGQQTRCYIDVSAPIDAMVEMPMLLQDTLVSGLYILDRQGIDSTNINNGRKRLSASYLLTSFDEGVYFIPPVEVKVDDELCESNYLTLKVITYEVDTTSMEIFDIKPVEKAPFVLKDYTQPFSLAFGCIGLLTLIVSMIVALRRPKESVEELIPEIILPAHVYALQSLDDIKEQKIWQQGRYKEYYSSLTDVLRSYMASRYEFSAMEMTSWEILEQLKKTDLPAEDLYPQMKQLLELSDFVKFAKMNPLPEDNDRSLRFAYHFVETTKQEETAAKEEADASEETTPDKDLKEQKQ